MTLQTTANNQPKENSFTCEMKEKNQLELEMIGSKLVLFDERGFPPLTNEQITALRATLKKRGKKIFVEDRNLTIEESINF